MTAETLAEALEREHHEIDAGIEEFLARRARRGDQAAPLRRALSALRRHIYLEEEFVFPPLDDAGLVAPIFVMLREHGEIWLTMDEIEAQLTRAVEAGPSEESCRELLTQLERHNSKEEAIVYPQADATLSAETDTELRAFLASGEMPDGWRCQTVRV
ncbi:MAG: hemerythrin domain-containing protein [Acidobacteriota bacterium]|nr:hemerythrin domain-containing protein [Acidobacteriota bacterium]